MERQLEDEVTLKTRTAEAEKCAQDVGSHSRRRIAA